ncbi:alpha/beta hydrolase family protein [uncultured Sphaerochaeta sp.]|uniref:alpha/beta hydrolase n=1 Tax=uncultured Sphaerochaeta sp. TaxID=886478 RepID=UPI002A0A3A15|nr:alpha/beta hydrolase family protein [uncultured Sphaerochaeta sp.]
MALFHCQLFSKQLFASVDVNVILPLPDSGNYFFKSNMDYPKADQKFQTLYLLHGISADYSDWVRFSGIERYAQEHQLAVVMPSASNSMYCNLKNGGNYYSFVAEELPSMVRSIFPLSDKREDNFIAGLSMGGYGAFKIGLGNPGRFLAIASLSGGLITHKENDGKDSPVVGLAHWFKWVYGENNEHYDANNEDLLCIVKNMVKEGALLPKIYQCCGTEDFLYSDNVFFRDVLHNLKVDVTYEEGPGRHDWDFWDPYIKKILDWLPLKNGFSK